MQDEVNTKVVAIAIKGGRITAEVLKKALAKFIEEIEKAEKQASQPKTYRGKQSIKHLVEQNAAISNIEVTDGNIKSFERTANKYGIDYALKNDTSEQPPRYLVFFKGRDVDVMTQAFKEFSAKTVKQLSLIHISDTAFSGLRFTMSTFVAGSIVIHHIHLGRYNHQFRACLLYTSTCYADYSERRAA